MKLNGSIAFVLLVLLSVSVKAQYAKNIRSDRPGQGNSSYSVGKGMLQIQSGIDFEHYDASTIAWNNIKPATVIRYGIGKRIDINGSISAVSQKNRISGVEHKIDMMFDSWTLGARANFVAGGGIVPALAIQANVIAPINAPDRDYGYSTLLSATEQLSRRFVLLVNVGVTSRGDGSKPNKFYVVNLGYSISAKLSTYIEGYGTISAGGSEHKWDGGFAYLLRNNLQLDLYGGVGQKFTFNDNFVSFGVSWRLPLKKGSRK